MLVNMSLNTSKTKLDRIYKELIEMFPDAVCELNFANVYQLLISTLLLLSAIDHFQKEKGLLRTISGYFLGIGGFVAFTGGNIYMLRSPDAANDGILFMYLTFVGVWILSIGFFLGIITIVRAHRRGGK